MKKLDCKKLLDEKEAEQAETELTYIEIILDLYKRIGKLERQLIEGKSGQK